MRLISHYHRRFRLAGNAAVAVSYFSLECELEAMRGVRIPQVALTLCPPGADPDTESVDADPELLAAIPADPQAEELRPLLRRLAGRFDGRPMGELASRAERLLPAGCG